MQSQTTGIHLKGSLSFEHHVVFKNISLELKSAKWNSLLGPSGIGKSTILRLLAGLKINGHFDGVIETQDGINLKHRVAYMAQNDLLLPWRDVIGNVSIGSELRQQQPDLKKALNLIKRVGLANHQYKKPNALSGGQKKRVALARTLMEEREIILLDEPFSALDARNREEMQELSAKLLKGRTILLVTHDPGEAARLSDHIFLMEQNSIKNIAVPPTDPVRSIDDLQMLACQKQLLQLLRKIPKCES
ncbi:MAG: ABC transporter ATP-binding protein [Pseudomonadota bacterium]